MNNLDPEVTHKRLTFYPIPKVGDSEVVFGAKRDRYFDRASLPTVPHECEELVQQLFFKGGRLPAFHKAVDPIEATRFVRALLCSFEPSHEAKIATVAYAIWLWSHPTVLDSFIN